jgi:hypothetical protein
MLLEHEEQREQRGHKALRGLKETPEHEGHKELLDRKALRAAGAAPVH